MYQHILFDLYGTLVDIHTNEQKPFLWQKLALYLGLQGAACTPQALRTFYRRAVAEAEETLRRQSPAGACPEIDIGAVFAAMYQTGGVTPTEQQVADAALVFRTLSLQKLRLFDGAADLLRTLRAAGKGVYLLSNAQALFTRPELQHLGLAPLFDGVLLSSQAGVKKPDPAFYHSLCRRYGLDPAACLMVGNDDEADCRGAQAAGMHSLYVQTEQSPPLTRPLPEGCTRIPCIAEAARYIL